MPVVKVKGMSCQHCAKSVTEVLEALGAKNVQVDLSSGNVTFEESAPIDTAEIKRAIGRIGFEVVGL
ncbi:MAG: cation transporter [Pseudodesulfovibrio sp.]|uniref:Heavy metal transport/detoxification protein n=1 Tax=Pseudodesulfovibrio aespoeensis (strain ATCC 700646 / DSM 10631 / Aspo-2) TaxID=643562 RepID=E6VRQ4_PSEA9|nr:MULTISPECIES: cation transporter [Pseudodesulfovibrio]MBU4191082.1 cation transporter [Pseudomonadota bacterium]ADU64191.1 Heavy metal transport/detoxification protein [Pseudodesulfovibrio aespoeensis Aspo-2]MBU4245387.1 cation transporter [Pseudomonadota bacterium]MBU4377567.1 cation transporter [Pseudomonadota bacterium]MBU4474643.1 cation transporter [Pseudomonadota bacterium]